MFSWFYRWEVLLLIPQQGIGGQHCLKDLWHTLWWGKTHESHRFPMFHMMKYDKIWSKKHIQSPKCLLKSAEITMFYLVSCWTSPHHRCTRGAGTAHLLHHPRRGVHRVAKEAEARQLGAHHAWRSMAVQRRSGGWCSWVKSVVSYMVKSGGWLVEQNPSEKYESQLGWLLWMHIVYVKISIFSMQ